MSAIFQTNFLIKTKGEMEVTVPGVGLPRWLRGKESACNSGDAVSIPGSGRSPGGGSDNPLQDSCPENPMGRGAWWATVHGVTKNLGRLRMHSIHHTKICRDKG